MEFKIVDDARRTEKVPANSPFLQAISQGKTVLVDLDGKKTDVVRRTAISALRMIAKSGYKVHTRSAKDGLIVWADPPQ